MSTISPEERLFNLVIALLASRNGLTKSQILSSVRGFADDAGTGSTAAIERKFERDKEFLRDFGITIEVDDDPALDDNQSQRYRIVPSDYELPAGSEFSSDELRLISLAGAVWRQGSLSAPAQFALTKLRGLGVDVSGASEPGPVRIVVNEPNVETLTAAAAGNQTVEFSYLAPGYESPALRRVVPIHVFLHDDRWHMHAWNLPKQAFRTYLVSRIVGQVVVRGNEASPFPKPASLDDVLARLEELWQANVALLRVIPGSEAQVRLTRRAESVDPLRIHFTDASLFADELVSYGAEVVVESPSSLRDLVLARLHSLLAQEIGL